MIVRDATDADLLAFAAVYESAVRTAGPDRYSPRQVEAWAAGATNAPAFGRRALAARTLVAEDDEGPAGFVTLKPDGRIGMLYVRGNRQRRGVGAQLLDAAIRAAEAAGASRVYAEASAFSLPVFERAGFVVTGTDTVERRGVRFERHLVERMLKPARARAAARPASV